MKEGILGLKTKIYELPTENLTVFKHLMKLLFKISSYADINLMNARNLSVCLTPTVFTIGDTDTVTLTKALKVLGDIIEHFNDLFPDDIDFLVYRKSRVLKRTTKLLNSNDDQVFGMLQKKIQRKSQMNPQKIRKSKMIREKSLYFDQLSQSSISPSLSSSSNPHSLSRSITTTSNTQSQLSKSTTIQSSSQSNVNKQISQYNQLSNASTQSQNQSHQLSQPKQQPPPPNPYPSSRLRQTSSVTQSNTNSSSSQSSSSGMNRHTTSPKPPTVGLSISERISRLQQDSK